MVRCMGCMREYDGGVEVCPWCGYVRGTPAREAYHLDPESILAGRYIVGRVLGYGGFGVTYIGWDAQLERVVAIKEFLPSVFATRLPGNTTITVYEGAATEQFSFGLERFVDEAQRLAQFNGIPGIVDIYDTFSGNNTAYIVMQFLQGQDVKEQLAAKGPMPYEQARKIILSVCDTLAPVHAQNIIHRDISPDNIYLTADGEVKLLDFGAARYESSVNSKSLSVILKAGYAPEEQYRSKGDQGPWTDVYALAATFYKMLTGTAPQDSMERAINDELKEPSKLGAQLPQSAENAILNALNIRKTDRTQSVEEFKQALLADGVERVKVKQQKSDSGKFPGWAKWVLGGAAALLLVFGLLSATGVINLGGVLQDDFGTAVPEGQVNTPGIVNLQEAEAKAAANKAGLDYQVVGTSYDDQVEKGKILSQDPLPGRLIDVGGVIQVTISGGSGADGGAGSGGYDSLPDMTYMTVGQAEWIIQNTPDVDLAAITYVWEEDVAEGLVMGYEPNEDNKAEVLLRISAGKDPAGDVGSYGVMRAPALVTYPGNSPLLTFACTSQELASSVKHSIMMSEDGSSWTEMKGPSGEPVQYFTTYVPDEETGVAIESIPLGTVFALSGEDISGKTLQLRVERFDSEDKPIDSLEIPQTYRFEIGQDAISLEGTQMSDWDSFNQLIDGLEARGEDLSLSYTFERYEKDVRNNTFNKQSFRPYKLTGNFEKGQKFYYMLGDRGGNTTAYCYDDGELWLLLEHTEARADETLGIFRVVGSGVDEDGNMSTQLTRPLTGIELEVSTEQKKGFGIS